MTKPKFHVKMTEPQIRKSFPILWSLNTGEDVDNAHTPILAHPSRKQFGNRQEVGKANSTKGSLAKGMIKPKMSTNCVTQHHSRIPGSAFLTGKKKEVT